VNPTPTVTQEVFAAVCEGSFNDYTIGSLPTGGNVLTVENWCHNGLIQSNYQEHLNLLMIYGWNRMYFKRTLVI